MPCKRLYDGDLAVFMLEKQEAELSQSNNATRYPIALPM